MSDRITEASLPGFFAAGICDYGRRDAAEMIEMLRDYARKQQASWEAVLAAADEDFRVVTYIGAIVQRQREVIQEGKTRRAAAIEEN